MQVFPEPVPADEPSPSRSKRSSSDKKKKLKKSGVRTKFVIESLRKDYFALKEENQRLRGLITGNLPDDVSKEILSLFSATDAPKASAANIDELTSQMDEADLDDEE